MCRHEGDQIEIEMLGYEVFLKVRSRMLKSIQYLTGSQWSCWRTGVICSVERDLVMIWTAEFCTSLWRSL